MKFRVLVFSLFSVSLLSPLVNDTPAVAGCAMVDVATQVSIRGSKTPSQQRNNVDMNSDNNCLGNSTTSTASQVYIGSEEGRQTRNSSHYVGGSGNNNLNTPVIGVPVEVQVDVYSPAHDPEFIKRTMR